MGSPVFFKPEDVLFTCDWAVALSAAHSNPAEVGRSSMSYNQWRTWSAVMRAKRDGLVVYIESNLRPDQIIAYDGRKSSRMIRRYELATANGWTIILSEKGQITGFLKSTGEHVSVPDTSSQSSCLMGWELLPYPFNTL